MKTVKGIYENGKIEILEKVDYTSNQKVLITFLDDEDQLEEKEVRNLSLLQPKDFLNEYLEDKREDLYQDYAKKNTK
jgi:FlaA1/EpsC-like NDP-sugar epimerase